MGIITRFLGYGLILLSIGILFFVFYRNTRYSNITRTFSPYTLLSSSWEAYKIKFINPDGRVIDYSQNSITTSEGQSYALLRSVWIDDKETFDKVWRWTKTTLQRKDNALFGWRWGQKGDGSYGFIENGGDNPASDADSDIALALILASNRWGDTSYRDEAKKILKDLWEKETGIANNKRYLLAGPWAQNETTLIINPSYFAPYAYRIFAKVDTEHDWESLIDPSYSLLMEAGTAPLDTGAGVGLPPNWIAMNKATGELTQSNLPSFTTDYSFDAMRVPWRIALDYLWNKDERARDYFQSSFPKLEEVYTTTGQLPTSFSHDGKIKEPSENPTMYSTALGYFLVMDPPTAKKIYEEKIIDLYSNDQNSFQSTLPYYEQNWLWFGAALYNNALETF